VPNFTAIALWEACTQICEILCFCDFLLSYPVLFWLYVFLATAPSSHHWSDFNRLWLKWRIVTQGCAFWGYWWQHKILRGSNPNWQNHKISDGEHQIDTKLWQGNRTALCGWSTMTKIPIQDGGRLPYTIRYDSGYLTCSKKLTGSQPSLPHGINRKLKCETKNKMMSVISPVRSRYHEAVQ